MAYNNLKYIIVPTDEIDSVDFSCVNQEREYVRYSTDGSKFIVKYEGNKPYCLYGKTVYTHEQMLAIVNDQTGEWYQEI